VEKIKLIDVSKCIGCRGCQIACKQWNQLPAELTAPSGAYQNPPDLRPHTWTLIRYREELGRDGQVKWLSWKDGCLHCTEATCVKLCPVGARVHLDYGAVARIDEKCIGCQSCVVACPFGKPKYSREANKAYTCNLCPERIQNNLPPACVKACPTGALKFGEKREMLKLAYKRVQELGGDASVYGDKFFQGTHVVYILAEKVALYSSLPAEPQVASSVISWKDLLHLNWLGEAGSGLALLALSSLFKRRSSLNKGS